MPATERAEYWDSYWNGGGDAAYAGDGPLQALLDHFWHQTAVEVAPDSPGNILDIASGAGAGSRSVLAHLKRPDVRLTLCDLSFNALKQANPAETGAVLANATCLPFKDQTFGLTLSQYGLEYAGLPALKEAARVTRQGGWVALLLHHAHGALQAENQRNLDATQGFIESGALPAFSHFARVVRQQEQAAAESAFADAVGRCTALLHHHGREVAGGGLLHIYRELAALHARLDAHDSQDIAQWCSATESELHAYAQRMSHMLKAALGTPEIQQYTACLEQCGFKVQVSELRPDAAALPVAWGVAARKQ